MMALQAGVSTSKVFILLGAAVKILWSNDLCLTSSIVLRSGRLSEIISQLQELLKGVEEVEISSFKYDSSLLAAQIRQLSQEIKELTLSRPGVIALCIVFNASRSPWSNGLLLHVVEDVMFVTKNNMANAVATVSKQLENVSEALASTKRHLSKRLENLDWKVEEQMETSKLIANDVSEMKSNLSEIGLDLDSIFQMVSGMEDKLQFLEGKQDVTNTGLLYLCQVAGGFKDAQNIKPFQEVSAKLSDHSSLTYEDKSLKGLQFLAETNELEVIDKSLISTKKSDLAPHLIGKVPTMKTKIHRSYPVGLSLARDLI